VAEFADRVIVEELDEAEGHRDRHLGVAAARTILHGPIGRIVAPQVAVTRQRDTTHPDAARVERELGARRPGGTGDEDGEREGDGCNSHEFTSKRGEVRHQYNVRAPNYWAV